jgi:hypothetical protein
VAVARRLANASNPRNSLQTTGTTTRAFHDKTNRRDVKVEDAARRDTRDVAQARLAELILVLEGGESRDAITERLELRYAIHLALAEPDSCQAAGGLCAPRRAEHPCSRVLNLRRAF